MKVKAIVLNNTKPIFWSLVAAIVFSLTLYVYCVNQTVRNVVKLQELETTVVSLHSSISKLEAEYIARTSQLDLTQAYALGFSNVSQALFVARTSSGQALSFRANR